MACLNPNCRSNQHTGVCRADARAKPFPIQPTRLIASPEANAQAQQGREAMMRRRDQDRQNQQDQFQRGQDARFAQQAQDARRYPLAIRNQNFNPDVQDANRQSPDGAPVGLRLRPMSGGGFQLQTSDGSQMNPMDVRSEGGPKRRDMPQRQDPRVPMLQQQLDNIRSQLKQAQDALSAATATVQAPCPACAQPVPPPPCPACPTCPDCGLQLPAGADVYPQQQQPIADVNRFIGQQLAPNFSSDTFVPTTQSDFYGLANAGNVVAAAAEAQGQAPPVDQGMVGTVLQVDSGANYPADQTGQTVSPMGQGEGSIQIANPGMMTALAPAAARSRLQEAPIVPIARLSRTLISQIPTSPETPSSGISGVCVNCKRPVAVGAMNSAATGAYTCNNCGYAHVGAPEYKPSPRASGARARHIVKMQRQGLYTLDQAQAKLKTKVGLSDADIAYALTH